MCLPEFFSHVAMGVAFQVLAKSDHGLIRDWCLCPGVASFSPCSYSHGANVTQGTPHKQNRNSYSISWWLLESRRRRMARSLGTETGTPCYSCAGHHCSGLGYLPINGHCLEPPCQIVLGIMVTGSVCTSVPVFSAPCPAPEQHSQSLSESDQHP